MADKAIDFGSTEGFGAFTGWKSLGTTKNTTQQRAVAHDDTGEEAASNMHDEKQEVTSKYECNNDTNTIPANLGDLVNALILTSIQLDTSAEGPAQMSLTGHNHTNNAHAASPVLKKAAHAVTIAKAFGVTDFLGDTDGTNDSAISSSITISCDHADQNDGDGDHLVGENHGGKIEAKTTYCGDHTVVATGFDLTTPKSEVDENTGFIKKEVTGVKALVLA
jgi:hypothetical protein